MTQWPESSAIKETQLKHSEVEVLELQAELRVQESYPVHPNCQMMRKEKVHVNQTFDFES